LECGGVVKFDKKCQELQKLYEEYTTVTHKGVEKEHLDYLRFLYGKKRTAATHVLVLMLSDELRKTKPYALPVQYIPYESLTDNEVQGFCNKLKRKMKVYGVKCVGMFKKKTPKKKQCLNTTIVGIL